MEKNIIYDLMMNLLKKMQDDPSSVTESDREFLQNIYGDLCKALKFSEHSAWKVDWVVEKWHSMKDKMSGIAPYEVVNAGQNIILDKGATEMLKLICGASATAYNNGNAKIYVGSNATGESASQTGVIDSNKAYANMDSGYPTVSGRTATFRATFGESSANFAWNEASITNGVSGTAMNRKVVNMGTKNKGTWTIQITISLVSA